MKLVVGPGFREFVEAHGGAVYVWSRTIGCCRARTHVLEAATERPTDRELELVHAADGFQLHAPPGLVEPQELHLEVSRGRLRASWNGQAWIG
jgi:hypothetical protein